MLFVIFWKQHHRKNKNDLEYSKFWSSSSSLSSVFRDYYSLLFSCSRCCDYAKVWVILSVVGVGVWGKSKRGRANQKKKETKRAGSSREFFSPRDKNFKGKKGLWENLLIVCVKEKLYAKRDTNKSCARVKLLLHGTTTVTTTLLNCSPLRSF